MLPPLLRVLLDELDLVRSYASAYAMLLWQGAAGERTHPSIAVGTGRGFRMRSFAAMLRTLTAGGIIPLSACAILPDANPVKRIAQAEPVVPGYRST